MRRRRPLQFLAASTLAAGVMLTGCGGGGGGGDAAANDAALANTPAVTPAAGVGAIPTDVLYGSPETAATHQVAESLPGFDQFGAPRDGFKQLVRENTGGSSGVGVPVDVDQKHDCSRHCRRQRQIPEPSHGVEDADEQNRQYRRRDGSGMQ